MLYDLHMHSCLSPCAEDDMTPANIAGLAKLAGAELIAVTDHNAADNLPAVQCCCNAYGLRLLPGVEVNTAEEIHVLCYFKTVDTALEFGRLLYAALPEFPYDPAVWGRQLVMDENDEVLRTVDKLLTGAVSMDIYEVKAACEALGGVAVPAHAARRFPFGRPGGERAAARWAGGAVLVGRAPHGGCGVQPACAGGGFCAAQAAVTWDLTPVPMEWNRDLLVFEMLLPYLKRGGRR